VVATAAAAPSFAAASDGGGCTNDGKVCVQGTGSGCKLPGHSTDIFYGYRMVVTFTNNTTTDPLDVTLVSLEISGKPTTGFPTGTTLHLHPGDNPEIFIVQSSSSSQRTATITYEYLDTFYTATVVFPNFAPCKCDPKDADPSDINSNCS
jgi:hypothetical protein